MAIYRWRFKNSLAMSAPSQTAAHLWYSLLICSGAFIFMFWRCSSTFNFISSLSSLYLSLMNAFIRAKRVLSSGVSGFASFQFVVYSSQRRSISVFHRDSYVKLWYACQGCHMRFLFNLRTPLGFVLMLLPPETVGRFRFRNQALSHLGNVSYASYVDKTFSPYLVGRPLFL